MRSMKKTAGAASLAVAASMTVATMAVATMAVDSMNPAQAADQAVITPGPFAPPPAYPQGPTVRPGPFEPPPAYPVARVYDWTGFYVGLNGGGAFGSTHWTSLVPVTPTAGTADFSGGLIGVTIGYNLQAGEPYVLGVEADLDWAGLKATTTLAAGCVQSTGTPTACELQVPWLGTGRLRFGYAFDGIMPYVTGGVALGNLKADTVGHPFGSVADTNLGWTAGGGIEVRLTEALRAKVEYLHVDLNGFSCNGPCNGGPLSFNANANVIRAGLNYRLWAY